MVMCASKNGHQKDICVKDIELHAKFFAKYSRFNSQHNQGDLYDHLRGKRFCTLLLKKIFI